MNPLFCCGLCFFLLVIEGNAQQVFQREKRDHIWLLGYDNNPANLIFGGSRLDFNYDPHLITYDYRDLNFDAANASMCDTEGNLLFYTNGIAIHNDLNELIENGDSLNPDPYTEFWVNGGYLLPQGVLALPYPEAEDKYVLLHGVITPTSPPINLNSYIVFKLLYTVLDMSLNGDEGKAVEKNIVSVADTLDFGKITATRHANGRDWWILQQEHSTNRYHQLLLSPEGLTLTGSIHAGVAAVSGLGQAVFAPNGSKYIHFTTHTVQDGQFIDIYDYERCSGQLDNHISINYNDTAFSGGVAVSPNSRFLYVSSNRYVYQYDLEAEDIEASQEVVAVYDGFLAPEPFPLPVKFFLCQLAPDNKIYISATSGVPYLHVIHNPNAKGAACQMEKHGVQLPTLNKFGIPNAPFYGLGPEDGSPCDTLGIDHHPQADFRYVVENSEVDFYDYSRFFPTNWHWTFGDGGSSTERDPVHTYAASGTYEVCLSVSNANASDTLCREIEIIVTDTREPLVKAALLKVFPNPTQAYVTLQFLNAEALPRLQALVKLEWVLYDAFGRELRSIQLQHPEAQTIINLDGLPAGMYFWQLKTNGAVLESGKLMSIIK